MSTAAAEPLDGHPAPATHRLGRRWVLGSVVVAFLLTFLQAPGYTVADTKYDLAQNPLGFLARASHLWNSQAPMGQVQNQAYGYFFPHGTFFAAGHLLGVPAWVTQRVWWALLLLAGFWGVVRLAELLGIGNRGSRVVAALAYALSPRVLTTLGSISSETAPMMLAPWVLLAPVALGAVTARRRDDRHGVYSPAGSAAALALMGAVNAVATAAAFLPAALWWISYRPNRRWWRFTRAWIPLLVLATCWWVVPLLLLGKVSPPFLDYIESAGVTTEWASLGEVLRGTDSWTPFVSPERIAGAVLVTQPAAVLATGLLAAAGLAGLASRSMPARGRLTLILFTGLVGICAGYAGALGGPFADAVRTFLDSGGAPLRNVHKLEPLIRLPLVLGLAHLLRRVPLPGAAPMRVWRSAFAHPERERRVAVAALILAALTLASSLAWTGRLAPSGAYRAVPGYWQQTADWLAHNAADTRALVVPGAPFGSQTWGLTRDEPLQALARTPWAVRDAIPLTPPGTIRAMDSVQRLIADGRPSTALAPTLIAQGIGILVLRNDLDPDTARAARPLLAHAAIEGSPGLHKVAEFGDRTSTRHIEGFVADGDLRPGYPAVQIYRVDAAAPGTPAELRSGTGAPQGFPGAYSVPLDSMPVVQGGPEVLERLRRSESGAVPSTPVPPSGPVLLAADAARAGLPDTSSPSGTNPETAPGQPSSSVPGQAASPGPGQPPGSATPHNPAETPSSSPVQTSLPGVTVTDTPMDRESDVGKVDDHNSALRAPTDPRRTRNRLPDYAVPGAPLVEGAWSGATITASSSAADATQLGGSSPGSSTAAVVDGDPSTAWLSTSGEHAVGQWLRLDLDHPIDAGILTVTTSPAALGDPVKWMEVRTSGGTTAARVTEPGVPVSVSLPPGRTGWVKITATQTENDTAGGQFGISELSLDDYSNVDDPVAVDIRHRVIVPPPPVGTAVAGWDLGQEFPGRSGCFDTPDRIRCSKGLALAAEEPGQFERTLTVPDPASVTTALTVRTRPGPGLAALLTDPARPVARGQADVGDLRGSAFAATDGDPATSWTAPEDTVRNRTGPAPTLTLELPAKTEVDGIAMTLPAGDLPARPTWVTVNLGDGPQTRPIDRAEPAGATVRIPLHPYETDRIELSLTEWKPVLDRTALGFAQDQPPGLADIEVLGPDYPAPADPNRPVTVDCAHGPTVSLAGRVVHTSVTASYADLLSGAPVTATVCPADAAPVDLPTGRVDVTVVPTDLFTVDRLQLTRPTAPAPLAAPAGTRVLVLPSSTNAGWRATTADGHALTPIVVDGWQQGWVVPAGTTGPITVSFPADRWYRIAIFGGLLLLLPLFALAIPWRRRSAPDVDPGPGPRTWQAPTWGTVAVSAAALVVSGPVGLVLAAVGAVAGWWRPDRTARVLPIVAGVFAAVAAAALSTGPWRSPDGYLGGSIWVQLPALIAVVATGLAACLADGAEADSGEEA
ncbi:alpha-(1-_3)-arabinofuranosyltransferase domain-containing protein [Nocardia stercoris]|uniref:DUF3367 domain-containing protein n=1 Tax=Nocardia stercoris TaxID=2483361 RepID=A0A3M2L8L8_9NOCA|nr:alpha-(1->3)-arabinofuranosyltransferase family protein [Nocardia stercoris]RMI33951.1 DUF3367 domain-containing protein [Nocardia stercoris]